MEEDVQVSTPAAKNTSATWYRINDMFKPKIARLECPTCGRSYNSNKSLRKHFKIHLPGYEPPKYRTVTVKETAETHKFVCDICGRRFMRKSNLTRHLKNHDIIRICEGCGKKHNDCQAHYNHKRKCKAYLTIYPKKDRAGRDETGDTKRWIETTEEYLSVYQHKCQMCQSRFALREHLDTHTEYCGDPFWLEDKGDHLKLLNENLRKANAERRRKVAFLKVVKKVNGEKQDKRNETVGCKRIKIDQMKRIKKLTFRPSAMGVVSHKVRKKYKATQKSLGKNSEKKKELLRKFKRKVNQRLLKCKQIIQRNTWYKCKLCGTFGRAESIINHLKGPTHKLQTPIVCGACTRDFRTLQDFSFHQALHSHKICRNSLMIRYTTIVHADKIKHALNHHERMKKSLACAVNVELKTGKQTVEWKTASKPDSTVVDHYQGKCLCGIVMRNLKEMMNHVSKVHKMILAFKCKHCITDNIFQNMSDFVKHLASQHSRRKICQTDFEEKFLLPLGNPSTKVLVNNMTFQEQSSATASLDTEPGAEIVGEENMKKEESGELTESQLIAKQNEFVKLALRQKFKEKVQVGKLRKSEEQVDVETMDTKRRKGPLLEEKNIVKAKGSSAAKKRRREREQIMEKYQETSSKLRAKQSLRKYKSIMGWKHKKNIKQHRLKTNVRYRPRVQKSRFLLNNQFALRDCLYQCSVCERYRIDKAQEIITHLSKVHNKQAVLECSLCRSIFCSLTQLSAHQYQHSNIKGEIGINILYTSIVNPRVGMNISQTDRTVQINDETQTLLSGNYPSQCHLCKKTFKSQLALLSHIRYIHNLVFGYKCRSCDQGIVFMEFQEFYDHTKKVHGKLNLSEADFEQVTVIKHQYEEQGAATSKTNVAPTRKQKTTIIHPANMYFVDLKAVKASVQANNPTPTQNVPKSRSRPIRPKYDPAFEYGEEVSLLSKRRKLDEPLPSKMTFCAGGATLLVPVSSNVPLVVKPDKSISNKMLTQDKPVTSCVPPALDKPVTSCVPLAVDKPVTSCVPLAKILSVTDQNGKEVTILVKGEPAEPANERNTSREEYSCGFCGKRFRFKIMLNQHMERMHKMHSREKREKAKQILQEKLLKGDIRLKKNVASKLRDMKVELDDIAKDVTISGNTMFMNSVNQNTLLQNQKRQVSSKVNAISTKKKSGGKKKSGWSDHNYVAKRVDQEPSEDTLLQCIFKQCSYKCKTENCMKKHMIRKHKKSNLPKLQPKIAEPKERSKDGNEEIYSGDSEHADMAELDDSAYKVESEADSEEEESCKLKTIKKNQKHSHTAQGKEEKQMYGMADVKMGYKSVFKCTEKDCNKTFTARDFMADHKKSAHGKDMMYVCNVCSLEYARMPCFRDHLNISHRDLGTVPFKIAESEIRSKDMNLIEVLICTVCGYGGTTENLKSHICKADTHKYYCPFCDKERNSSIYEEIRDHIDKEHSENTVQQTAGKHDTGSDSIEAGSSMPTVHTAATETITENSGGPEPPENTISSKSTDDHTNTESATSSGDAETGDTAASKNRDSADIETVTAGGGVVVPDKLGAQDSDVLAEEQVCYIDY